MKKQALRLYLEGSGFRSIGRLLGVSEVPILNLESKETAIAEVDEMYTYIGSKKLLVNLDCRRQNGETIS
ncbi:hypothetical protein Barb6_01092 [Bacteroidales bacterium Barb6]|nr:hypothetical protein Barb6_01092 [Bacteroidales bacterium Barb6]